MGKNNDYEVLSKFWDEQFKFSDEDAISIKDGIDPDEDWKQFAPAKKLLDAVSSLGDCKNVLDYGCGYGWASIIAAKAGNCFVKSVDVAPNGIKLAKVYQDSFGLNDRIDFECIDTNWLSKEADNKYDGFFCSNVLDVVPFDMALDIIKEVARITTKDAKIFFSFNYYVLPEKMLERGATVEDNNIYINNVLRLVSLKDESWKDAFSKYFEVESLDYFAWPGEKEETRRLFKLKKK